MNEVHFMEKENEQDKLLKRINELAKKNKAEGLTADEKKEREQLRQQYLANFRAAFRSNLEHTKFYNQEGKEVTPEKLRQAQRKSGLRKD